MYVFYMQLVSRDYYEFYSFLGCYETLLKANKAALLFHGGDYKEYIVYGNSERRCKFANDEITFIEILKIEVE